MKAHTQLLYDSVEYMIKQFRTIIQTNLIVYFKYLLNMGCSIYKVFKNLKKQPVDLRYYLYPFKRTVGNMAK